MPRRRSGRNDDRSDGDADGGEEEQPTQRLELPDERTRRLDALELLALHQHDRAVGGAEIDLVCQGEAGVDEVSPESLEQRTEIQCQLTPLEVGERRVAGQHASDHAVRGSIRLIPQFLERLAGGEPAGRIDEKALDGGRNRGAEICQLVGQLGHDGRHVEHVVHGVRRRPRDVCLDGRILREWRHRVDVAVGVLDLGAGPGRHDGQRRERHREGQQRDRYDEPRVHASALPMSPRSRASMSGCRARRRMQRVPWLVSSVLDRGSGSAGELLQCIAGTRSAERHAW
jgi:hypothetical protein